MSTIHNKYPNTLYPFGYQKTDDDQYVRDSMTSAILNIDHAEFEAYRKNRERALKAQAVIAEVDYLRSELSILKNMVAEFINNHNDNTNK